MSDNRMSDDTPVNDDTKVTGPEAPAEKAEELTPKELQEVAGGAFNAFLYIDGIDGHH